MLPADWLDQLKAAYPKRDGGGDGKKIVTRLVLKAVAEGAEWERILRGAQNYARYCGRKGFTGTEYVMMLQTFVGRDWHFDDWADKDLRTPAQKREDAEREALTMRAQALGHKEVDWSRGTEAVRLAVELAESKRLRIVK